MSKNQQVAVNFGNLHKIPLINAQAGLQLIKASPKDVKDLAINILKLAAANKDSEWLPIGIATYKVVQNTAGVPTGRGNTAGQGEGRVNAVKNLAAQTDLNYKTLYNYRDLAEQFIFQRAAGSIKKEADLTIRYIGIPITIFELARATDYPYKAMDIAVSLKSNGDLSSRQFKNALASSGLTLSESGSKILPPSDEEEVIPASITPISVYQEDFSSAIQKLAQQTQVPQKSMGQLLIGLGRLLTNEPELEELSK